MSAIPSLKLTVDLEVAQKEFNAFSALELRANTALYGALAMVMAIAIEHNHDEIFALAEKQFTVQKNTHVVNALLKMLYGHKTTSHIKQVSAWASVLKEAAECFVSPDQFPEWVASNGGIEGIRNKDHKKVEEPDAPAIEPETPASNDVAPMAEDHQAERISAEIAPVAAFEPPADSNKSDEMPAAEPVAPVAEAEPVAVNAAPVTSPVEEATSEEDEADDAQAAAPYVEPEKMLPPLTRAQKLLNGPYVPSITLPGHTFAEAVGADISVIVPILRRNAAGDWDVICVWTEGPPHMSTVLALGDYLNGNVHVGDPNGAEARLAMWKLCVTEPAEAE